MAEFKSVFEKRKRRTLGCWKGYERVPGTKRGAKKSCRKKGSGKRGKI